MKFNKITETDLLNKGVLGLPDTPGLTTHDMQAKFDELVRDVMVPKFNALMDELSVIANINEVTQTVKNTETSIPTGKAVTGYVADTQKNMALVPVFKSKGEFPEKGDTNRIYIDDTVSPRLLYTWSAEEGYVLTGGEGSSLIILPLTYAEYVALPEEEKMRDDVIYEITDRDYGVRFGESDISKIGDGSVTGAISELDYSKADASKKTTAFDVEDVAYTNDIPEYADDGDAKISMIGGTTKKSKNLIPYPYTNTTKTEYELTWTDKRDGTLVANGTPTTNTWFKVMGGVALPKGEYILSGCPEGGGSSAYRLRLTTDGSETANDFGRAGAFTVESDGMKFDLSAAVYAGVTANNLTFKPMIRPATETDDTYKLHFDGLRSAPVTEVESVGKNLFGGEALADKLVEVANATKNETEGTITYTASNVGEKVLFDNFKPNTQYTFIVFGSKPTSTTSGHTNLRVRYTDGTYDDLNFQTAGAESYAIVTSDAGKTISSFRGTNMSGTIILYYDKCGVFEGVLTVDEFEPYPKGTLPIPEAVQALDGYGDGISDTVYNYVDFEKKQYVKRVGKVDMGTLSWEYVTSYTYPHFTTGISGDNIKFNSTSIILLCAKYREISGLQHSKFRIRDYDKCICNITDQIVSLRLAVQDSAYTDAETFKAAMSGEWLYYELATPEITDISDILTDNYISVESGGTLTFANEYGYAVPHKFTYYKTDIKIKGTAEKAVCDADGNDIAAKFKALEAELATLKASLS